MQRESVQLTRESVGRSVRIGSTQSGPRVKADIHLERFRRARWVIAQRRKALELARAAKCRRMEGVTVRYECPICGEPHKRADHRL